MFPYSAFFLLLGLVTMIFVRHGDGMSEHDVEVMQEHILEAAAAEASAEEKKDALLETADIASSTFADMTEKISEGTAEASDSASE